MSKLREVREGSTIGIVGLSNYADIEDIERCRINFENLGYKVLLGDSCFRKWFNFAGDDESRARDFESMFLNPEVDAVMALRGGYGCSRIISLVDFQKIENNPKLFIGFSDVTIMHIVLNQKCDIPSVHGPMFASDSTRNMNKKTGDSLANLIFEDSQYVIDPEWRMGKIINSGSCTGKIIGGNLELIRSTLGTPYEIDTDYKLLFVEEIGEYTFRIDRAFQQLQDSGKFNKCAGIILGDFKNCNKQAESDFSLNDIFEQRFKNLNIPVISSISSGHCNPMLSIPFGIDIELNANKSISVKLVNRLFAS